MLFQINFKSGMPVYLQLDNRITKIFGAPEYHDGEHVLLFLTPTPRGDYQTTDLYVGKFSEETTLADRRAA